MKLLMLKVIMLKFYSSVQKKKNLCHRGNINPSAQLLKLMLIKHKTHSHENINIAWISICTWNNTILMYLHNFYVFGNHLKSWSSDLSNLKSDWLPYKWRRWRWPVQWVSRAQVTININQHVFMSITLKWSKGQ